LRRRRLHLRYLSESRQLLGKVDLRHGRAIVGPFRSHVAYDGDTQTTPGNSMPIKPQELAALMIEVEREDPIDYADLPFGDEELRELVASHLCEMADAMENFSSEDRLMTMLAVAAKLVLENLVLNIQLLRRHGQPVSENVEELLGRLRKKD
jgi:hypothetical protein